jgi:hypothetical protein
VFARSISRGPLAVGQQPDAIRLDQEGADLNGAAQRGQRFVRRQRHRRRWHTMQFPQQDTETERRWRVNRAELATPMAVYSLISAGYVDAPIGTPENDVFVVV